ncbi:MAG: RNA 2',3'-cyclic phosphodiesterase [Candidatus Aminicenantes bacterium]|nr:RNA 2',3'-cyclic phosphodiesterase [Candidatus Aminicenantes bacterium]
MRTFIAIDLDPALKDRVALLVQKLSRANPNVKWTDREGMHLTLKFLGEIDDAQAEAVKDGLRAVAARHHPFELGLRGTGTFPPGSRNPRVLWAGFEPRDELSALQADIEEELAHKGFPKEERPFRPHLTLGRVRTSRDIQKTVRELESWAEFEFGYMGAKAVTLFESTLTPEGARYTALGEFPLA